MSLPGPIQVGVNQLSSADEKIALFRSLFRGREDIYPRRFESRKTGKSGYAPACATSSLPETQTAVPGRTMRRGAVLRQHDGFVFDTATSLKPDRIQILYERA